MIKVYIFLILYMIRIKLNIISKIKNCENLLFEFVSINDNIKLKKICKFFK